MDITLLQLDALIKPIEQEEKTSAGIYVPTTANRSNTMCKGEIVKLAPKVKELLKKEKVNLKEGDTVLYLNSVGTPLVSDGQKYVFLTFTDLRAKI